MIRYIIVLTFMCGSAMAQMPEVISIDKVTESTEGIVSIAGNGFGNTAGNLVIFFGAAKATIETASDQLIEVRVPAGATYENISVTHTPSGRTAYSRQPFLLSFGGATGIDLASLQGQTDFNAATGLYDFCMCDFNNDNKTDIITANFKDFPASTEISVLTNTSSGTGNINFTTSSINIAARSFHAKCGDLNGDGKPDLVITEADGDRVFILQNNSAGAISFLAPQIITLPGAKTKQIQVADLDGDKRPEVIVSSIGKSDKIYILVNQSSGAISFAPTVRILNFKDTNPPVPTPNEYATDGLVAKDLNNDGKPDIVLGTYVNSNGMIFLFRNTSIPGNISFDANTTIDITGSAVGIEVGDIDGDNKPDIAIALFLSSQVAMLRNESTATSLNFTAQSPSNSVLVGKNPWGLDFGDIDGDGKTDIAVSSLGTKTITLLNNQSIPGVFNFDLKSKPVTYINRHINVGDLDGDGKPDVAFASVDDNANGVPASKISVFRNSACMIPEITPEGPLTICAGSPLRLFATAGKGTTYQWKINGVAQPSTPNPFFDVTVGGNYTVVAVQEGGACSEESDPVTINVGTGTTTGTALPSNNGPICASNTLNLSVNNVGATQYLWTGPNNYTGTGLTPLAITNFQPVNAGRYYVDVMAGPAGSPCLAQRVSTLVQIIDIPEFQVGYAGGNVICSGDTKVLSVVPNPAGFIYQWTRNGSDLPGENGATLNATAGGIYTVKAKYTLSAGCSDAASAPLTLTVVSTPSASFTAPSTACASQKVSFTNTSTTDVAAPASYLWAFGDGQTSSEKDPVHQFTSVNTFNVTLTVTYDGGSCPDDFTAPITVTPSPSVSIVNPSNKYKFCEGDSLLLELNGTFDTYLWTTGETTPSIYAKDGGIMSVDVKASNGCVLTANKEIITDPAPTILITADPLKINEGETTQLSASGVSSYTWTPPDGLSATNIANPVASPTVTTTYTVTGPGGSEGCFGRASVEIEVQGEAIVNKLKPAKLVTPNGDAKNDKWVVGEIEKFTGCEISIYDDKGVRVYQAKPYNNEWDGTFKGKALPDGVYYYIIRCDGEENTPRTGSITVLR